MYCFMFHCYPIEQMYRHTSLAMTKKAKLEVKGSTIMKTPVTKKLRKRKASLRLAVWKNLLKMKPATTLPSR